MKNAFDGLLNKLIIAEEILHELEDEKLIKLKHKK